MVIGKSSDKAPVNVAAIAAISAVLLRVLIQI
jgi:hypothetical protein